jgi:hypothetical protein
VAAEHVTHCHAACKNKKRQASCQHVTCPTAVLCLSPRFPRAQAHSSLPPSGGVTAPAAFNIMPALHAAFAARKQHALQAAVRAARRVMGIMLNAASAVMARQAASFLPRPPSPAGGVATVLGCLRGVAFGALMSPPAPLKPTQNGGSMYLITYRKARN